MPITTVELKTAPELLRVIRAAQASYRKHKALLTVSTSVTLSGTYWDEGSRNEYYAVRLSDGYCLGAPKYNPPQFGGPKTAPVCDIPEGVAIVELGTFCGKPATAVVTLHPSNAAKLLPQATQASA